MLDNLIAAILPRTVRAMEDRLNRRLTDEERRKLREELVNQVRAELARMAGSEDAAAQERASSAVLRQRQMVDEVRSLMRQTGDPEGVKQHILSAIPGERWTPEVGRQFAAICDEAAAACGRRLRT